MTLIYRIHNDSYNFQEFQLDVDDFIDLIPEDYEELYIYKFSYHNMQLKKWWSGVESAFKTIADKPEAPIPDICTWLGASIVLSPKAFTALSELLSPYGEFLAVTCASKTYHIFNCLTLGQVDEINSAQIIENGTSMGVEKLAFNAVDVDGKIAFKTQFNHCMDLFCNESLKQKVEEAALTGIIFDENLAANF